MLNKCIYNILTFDSWPLKKKFDPWLWILFCSCEGSWFFCFLMQLAWLNSNSFLCWAAADSCVHRPYLCVVGVGSVRDLGRFYMQTFGLMARLLSTSILWFLNTSDCEFLFEKGLSLDRSHWKQFLWLLPRSNPFFLVWAPLWFLYVLYQSVYSESCPFVVCRELVTKLQGGWSGRSCLSQKQSTFVRSSRLVPVRRLAAMLFSHFIHVYICSKASVVQFKQWLYEWTKIGVYTTVEF